MKRRLPGGKPDGESYAKRLRVPDPSEFEDFDDEALSLAQSLASEIVGQRLGEWFSVSPSEHDDTISFFFGQPQDFIEQSLLGGEQEEHVFGTPEESVPGTPESSDEESEYLPVTPEDYQDEPEYGEVQASFEEDSEDQQDEDEEFLSDPEQYAWDLAMEMTNEIIDELYDENAAEDDEPLADAEFKQEILEMSDINELQIEICQAIYEDILEEWSSSYAS